MTMQSSTLLPALRDLPGGSDGAHQSFREIMAGLVSTDRAMYAAEFAAGASFGMWYIFNDRSVTGINVWGTGINVDDSLAEAYATRWPGLVKDHSLHEQWQGMIESGEGIGENEWFYSGLKGQLAEFKARDLREQDGFTNKDFPRNEQGEVDPTNEGYDIIATNPNGQEVFSQVKTGVSDSQYYDTLDAMESTNYPFDVGTELYDRISESHPELVDRLTDIGPDAALVEGTTDGLTTLSANMGIDVPDSIVEIVPFAGAIIAGVRLVHSVIKTEGEFKAVDRTAKNKIQVVQSLTLMSRIGINTVLATVGGMGGGAVGSVLPGVGNLIGGIVGTVTGAGMGMLLNKRLQPRMLDLALNITGLGHDDLFYYKNKVRIDEAALSLRQTAGQLAEVPRLPPLPVAA